MLHFDCLITNLIYPANKIKIFFHFDGIKIHITSSFTTSDKFLAHCEVTHAGLYDKRHQNKLCAYIVRENTDNELTASVMG